MGRSEGTRVKDAVKDHLKKLVLPPRKHLSLPPGFDWLAFRVQPGKEYLTEYHLSRMGKTVFIPVETKARRVSRHAKRVVKKEIPILARYIFVGFVLGQPARWQEVCRFSLVQGVLAVWEMDGLLHPVVITESQMNVMLGDMATVARTNPRRSYGVGDLVRIVKGAFSGHSSVLEEIKGQKGRLTLQVLGSQRGVEVSLDVLEAA